MNHNEKSLAKPGIKAKKSLGQHFLFDTAILDRIVKSADISAQDTIIEVGPGLGTLTRQLSATAKRVIAIEKDGELMPRLQTDFEGVDNISFVQSDILQWTLPSDITSYKVVANIPYYISTPIITYFLRTLPLAPESITILVQKEYAQKAVATPPRASSFSNMIHLLATPTICFDVAAGSFTPPPKVTSSVLKLDLKPHRPPYLDQLLKFIEQGFVNPRKTLRNNIKYLGKEVLDTLPEDLLKRRPETLSPVEWEQLFQLVTSYWSLVN